MPEETEHFVWGIRAEPEPKEDGYKVHLDLIGKDIHFRLYWPTIIKNEKSENVAIRKAKSDFKILARFLEVEVDDT